MSRPTKKKRGIVVFQGVVKAALGGEGFLTPKGFSMKSAGDSEDRRECRRAEAREAAWWSSIRRAVTDRLEKRGLGPDGSRM